MTYTCISSPFSNQGLPAVTSNEFFVYTPLAPMFAHCLYNNYSYMYSHLKFEISLMNFKKSGIRWSQPYQLPTLSTDTPCPEAERLVTTVNVTPKKPNSNSLLSNTALLPNDIQQHVNSGDVDIRNLTITLIRTVVLHRSWYQMPG